MFCFSLTSSLPPLPRRFLRRIRRLRHAPPTLTLRRWFQYQRGVNFQPLVYRIRPSSVSETCNMWERLYVSRLRIYGKSVLHKHVEHYLGSLL